MRTSTAVDIDTTCTEDNEKNAIMAIQCRQNNEVFLRRKFGRVAEAVIVAAGAAIFLTCSLNCCTGIHAFSLRSAAKGSTARVASTFRNDDDHLLPGIHSLPFATTTSLQTYYTTNSRLWAKEEEKEDDRGDAELYIVSSASKNVTEDPSVPFETPMVDDDGIVTNRKPTSGPARTGERDVTIRGDRDEVGRNPVPGAAIKRAKNEDLDYVTIAQENPSLETDLDKTVNAVFGAIAFCQKIPSKVEEAIEKTQQLPGKVTKSVQETKKSVEETIETTQKVVKTVQEFPDKVTKSVQETKESVEETIETTQKAVKTVEEFPGKVKESIEDTAHDVKVLFGLERPSLKKRMQQQKIPMTAKEEALDLAGKATVATAKVAIWAGKGVGSMAWKGTKLAYNNTIGPAVEETWNEQVASINNAINATTKAIQDVPSKITSPSSEVLDKRKDPKRPSFTRKRERKETTIVPDSVSKIITKSPAQLQKEINDAQNLAKEISAALDAAERAMKMNPNRELEDPMIEIGEVSPAESTSKAAVRPSTARNNGPFWNRRQKQNKTPSIDVLARLNVAKTQDQLDAELKEEQALEKEIADALAMAEQALMTSAPANSGTSDGGSGDSKKNTGDQS